MNASRTPITTELLSPGYRIADHGTLRTPARGTRTLAHIPPRDSALCRPTIARLKPASAAHIPTARQPREDLMAMTETKPSVTIKDLATSLKTDPRTLRAFLREHELGCGRGARYAWASLNDPAVKRIAREWEKALVADEVAAKAP